VLSACGGGAYSGRSRHSQVPKKEATQVTTAAYAAGVGGGHISGRGGRCAALCLPKPSRGMSMSLWRACDAL
jgi:hypothetical protein